MLLRVQNLSKSYPTPGGGLSVLRDVSFDLPAGEALAIIGPSGSGKSTLLNIIAALEPPSGGRVLVDGGDPFESPPEALARFRNRTIGLVFQDHHLLAQCSALENVLIPTLVDPAGGSRLRRAGELLRQVGLESRASHRPAELSGGERQRVALARALINEPRLLLADEPTGSLDTASAERVTELLLELGRGEQRALIVITHNAALARRMTRTLSLHDGVLSAAG